MKSKTSLFSPALFRKNLTRFAPLWAIFLALMVLAGPVSLLSSRSLILFNHSSGGILSDYADYYYGRQLHIVIYNFIYAPLCAGMLFRYLHRTRSAYMMHAFPLNRSTQFVTNVVSGLAFAVVPFVLQFALNLLVSIGLPGQRWLLVLLAVEILSYLFFFALAVFCMQITGNSIISVLSYIILNFVFAAVPAMFTELLDMITFGLNTDVFTKNLSWLIPIVRMMTMQDYWEAAYPVEWAAFGIYGLLGCVLLALSWLQYRVRHLEQAGEAMISRWSRVGFLLLFTVFCTLGVGLILSVLFCDTNDTWRNWLVPMLLFFLFASFAAWFGAQMMLNRTVRVFHKRQVLGWICTAVITVALICGLHFDVFGIQRYVPAQADLQEATLVLDTQNSIMSGDLNAELTVTDLAVLEAVLQEHQAAYDRYAAADKSYNDAFTVSYQLKSGRRVVRRIPIRDDYNTTQLSRLLSNPEYCVKYYEDVLSKVLLDDSELSLMQVDGDKYINYIHCDRTALREAIVQDAAEGNLKIPFSFEYPPSWQLMDGSTWIWLSDKAVHTFSALGVEP